MNINLHQRCLKQIPTGTNHIPNKVTICKLNPKNSIGRWQIIDLQSNFYNVDASIQLKELGQELVILLE